MDTGHGLVMDLRAALDLFLESFKQNGSYRDGTFKVYESCLRSGSESLLSYAETRSLVVLQNINYEFLEGYKLHLLERTGGYSVRKYVTSVRQFLNYSFIKGWVSISGNHFHMPPKGSGQKDRIISDEVLHEILNRDWGKGDFYIMRNRLILHFLIKAGLGALEICNIQLSGFTVNGSKIGRAHV